MSKKVTDGIPVLNLCPRCNSSAFVHMAEQQKKVSGKMTPVHAGYEVLCMACDNKTPIFGTETEAVKSWNAQAHG